jgi:hypothetical protein
MWGHITAYRISQIVRTAAVFSLAEHAAAGPITAESISTAESTDLAATARLLRGCAAYGLLTCDDDVLYRGTPLLDTLRRDAEGSQWGFAMSLPDEGHWRMWGHLSEAVRTGRTQAPETVGTPDIFAWYGAHQDEAAPFFEGLNGMTAVAGADAARIIDTTGFATAVDVGGATGTLMQDLMAVNPKLKGIVYDTPEVAVQAQQAADELGLGDRLTGVGGDFFASVPEGADAYLLRYVLHDWDDKSCVTILTNCRQAMATGSKVFVLEMVLGKAGSEDPVIPSQDLNMLAILHGRERSVAEFDQVLEAAGLKRTKVTPTAGSQLSVIEAVAV